jgi:cytochrome b involved in lipid metabolism
MAPPKRTSPFLANSPQVARGRSLPIPNRGGPSSSSSLAPPPTHSQAPQKPSRKVLLTPGHSPLDWARISGPNADLRNLPSDTPYLKVTPSMLKHYNGRKGKDAWTALGGRVYNITPYVPYHPGGGPELLRCAGRDGTKLFGEVHPWVNYETMLTACLVGLLVPEEEAVNKQSKMDEMD